MVFDDPEGAARAGAGEPPEADTGRFIDNGREVGFRRGLQRAAREGFDLYVADAREGRLADIGPLEAVRLPGPDGEVERQALRLTPEVRRRVTGGEVRFAYGASDRPDAGQSAGGSFEAGLHMRRDDAGNWFVADRTGERQSEHHFGDEIGARAALQNMRSGLPEMGNIRMLPDGDFGGREPTRLAPHSPDGGPRVPGAGRFFEDRITLTKRVRGGDLSEAPQVNGALRGSVREDATYGHGVLGEGLFHDPLPAADPDAGALTQISADGPSVMMVRALFARAAREEADWVAIPTGAVANRIQPDGSPAAGERYDAQLKNVLERVARDIGGSELKVERVTLATPPLKRGASVWMVQGLTPEMHAKVRQGLPMFGAAERAPRRGSTTPEIEQEVRTSWAAAGSALLDSGVLKVVDGVADIPLGDLVGDIPPWVGAVHDIPTGTTYLIAPRLRRQSVRSLVLHEVGVHHGLEKMIGRQRYNGLKRVVEERINQARQNVLDAYERNEDPKLEDEFWERIGDRVARNYEPADPQYGDELLAYAAEDIDALISQLPEAHPDRTWWEQIMDAVRRWFTTTFGVGKVTLRDVHTLAVASLQRVSRAAGRQAAGGMGLVESGRVLNYAQARGFDGDDPMAAARYLDERGYFSAVAEAVRSSDTRRAPGAQWWATISKAKGVKKEELEWIGLQDWLEAREGPVTREEVQAFIHENGVRVEETLLGGEGALTPEQQARLLPMIEERDRLRAELADFEDKLGRDEAPDWYDAAEARIAELDQEIGTLEAGPRRGEIAGGNNTKWSQYTLPGGENYRELLLRLPEESDALRALQDEHARLQQEFAALGDRTGERGREIIARLKEIDAQSAPLAQQFRSPHFDAPNILAHVRFNERTDSAGKRTLFIEEVQSDWHQRGREYGYMENAAEQQRRLAEINALRRSGDIGAAEARRLSDESRATSMRPPDAPFKNNAWASLAMKRMIRWASEQGFDQIAWTRGQQQIERFNLAQTVGQISAMHEGAGRFLVYVEGKDGHALFRNRDGFSDNSQKSMTDAEMREMFGEGIANQLKAGAEGRSGGWFDLRPEDFKVGGGGMREFYDRILPRIANDLGKKYGARVSEATVGSKLLALLPNGEILADGVSRRDIDGKVERILAAARAQASSRIADIEKVRIEQVQETVHALQITPEMRKGVMRSGFALFGAADGGTPMPSRINGRMLDGGEAPKNGGRHPADYRRPGSPRGPKEAGLGEMVAGQALGASVGGVISVVVANERDREARRAEYERLEEERRKSQAQLDEQAARRLERADLDAALEAGDWQSLPELENPEEMKSRAAYVEQVAGWAEEISGVPAAFVQALIARETAYTLIPDIRPIGRDGRPLSGAIGWGQFIPDTWAMEVMRNGQRLGINVEGRTRKDIARDPEILALREDPRVAGLMTALHARENILELQERLGREVTGGEAYAAHFLGVDRAVRFIADVEAGLGPAATHARYQREANVNPGVFKPGGRPRSAADIMADFSREFGNEAIQLPDDSADEGDDGPAAGADE